MVATRRDGDATRDRPQTATYNLYAKFESTFMYVANTAIGMLP